jgi:hypothetical protein
MSNNHETSSICAGATTVERRQTNTMNLCSDGHEEVCYECIDCPVCEVTEEKNDEIHELEVQVSELEDQLEHWRQTNG